MNSRQVATPGDTRLEDQSGRFDFYIAHNQKVFLRLSWSALLSSRRKTATFMKFAFQMLTLLSPDGFYKRIFENGRSVIAEYRASISWFPG